MWGHEDDEELVGVPDARDLRDTALHALNNYCKVTARDRWSCMYIIRTLVQGIFAMT